MPFDSLERSLTAVLQLALGKPALGEPRPKYGRALP